MLEHLAASGSLEGDVVLDACEWKVRRVGEGLTGGAGLQGGKSLVGDVLLDVHGTGLPCVEEALPVDKGLAFWGACVVVKGQYIASVAENSVRVCGCKQRACGCKQCACGCKQCACVAVNSVHVTANSVCVCGRRSSQ